MLLRLHSAVTCGYLNVELNTVSSNIKLCVPVIHVYEVPGYIMFTPSNFSQSELKWRWVCVLGLHSKIKFQIFFSAILDLETVTTIDSNTGWWLLRSIDHLTLKKKKVAVLRI